MDTDISKYLTMYLCMMLAVSFFFPQIILGGGETNILGLFKVGINSTTNEPYIQDQGWNNSDLDNQFNNDPTNSGWFHKGVQAVTSFFQWIVDGLGNVLGTIKILFAFIFSPFIFVLNPSLMGNAPFYVQMIFAIPLVFIAFLGTLKFIRGLQ